MKKIVPVGPKKEHNANKVASLFSQLTTNKKDRSLGVMDAHFFAINAFAFATKKEHEKHEKKKSRMSSRVRDLLLPQPRCSSIY